MIKKKQLLEMVKVRQRLSETRNKINSIDFDAHWYRRVFHTFGTVFLFYYLLPDDVDWILFLKDWLPPFIVILAITLEILRLKGKISSSHFFGLRLYEKNRVGSYVFFGMGILLLLRFFPQQIAIPCILCACLGDPIIGEIRRYYEKKYVYILGFLVCMLFFMITWFKADIWLLLLVSIIGGFGAIIGEIKKFWWLDDDFTIQILPAILLSIVWLIAINYSIELPGEIILPSVWPW